MRFRRTAGKHRRSPISEMNPPAPLDDILGQPAHGLVGLAGVAVLGFAVWFQWKLSWLRSDVEEAEKEEKITAKQARTRLRILRSLGPVLMALGMALVGVAVVLQFREPPV